MFNKVIKKIHALFVKKEILSDRLNLNKNYKYLTYKEMNDNFSSRYIAKIEKLEKNFIYEKEKLLFDNELNLNDSFHNEYFETKFIEILNKYIKLNEYLFEAIVQYCDNEEVINNVNNIKYTFWQFLQKEKYKYKIFSKTKAMNNIKRPSIYIYEEIFNLGLNNNEIKNMVYKLYDEISTNKFHIKKLLIKKYQYNGKKEQVKLKPSFCFKYEELIRKIYIQLIEYDKDFVIDFFEKQKKEISNINDMIENSSKEEFDFYNIDGNEKIKITYIINSYIQNTLKTI